MAMSLGFVVGILGVVILSHAAYSTVQYRGLLKIMEEEFSGPPLTVVAELLLGLVFCMWATLTVPGTFLSIHPHSEENRIVSLPDNLDFMIFNHRARVFPVELDLKFKHSGTFNQANLGWDVFDQSTNDFSFFLGL